MKISGFTMAKNASKLYYPIRQAIESILPICDEFIVAIGDCDSDDCTLEEIQKINSPKIKIINTIWDIEKYPNGTENAHQSNIAKDACTGDWLFYVQADEIVHEKYLPEIVKNCELYLNNEEVEGFLFKYRHFFGDYQHYIGVYGWYPKEIRIVRNKPDIYSFISAQSFSRVPNFDGKNYRQKEGVFRLKVVEIKAYIYHYGWVRPPELMQKKQKSLDTIHKGKQKADELYKQKLDYFDYGNISKLDVFKETHPKVLEEWISKFDWQDKLHYEKNYIPNRKTMKHERLKSKILTFIERKLLFGLHVFGYSNWKRIKPKIKK